MFVLIKDNAVKRYPYTISDLKRDNPNVSFASSVDVESLQEYGVYAVHLVPQPVVPVTQTVENGMPVFNAETNRWEQTWVVRDFNEEETAQRALQIRDERNRRIAESDWTQLSDAPVNKNAWAMYRHDLRSVPEQEGFPWNVSWPVPPS